MYQVEATKAEVSALSTAWQGERLDDGRPLVPDHVLDELRNATSEQVWHVLSHAGYKYHFCGGWQGVFPDRVTVGRVVTAQFVPKRADLDTAVLEFGSAREGFYGDQQNAWVVDMLRPGDIMVADIFGKVREGTVIGDNLGTAIAARTGVGAIIDGGVRDLDGLGRAPSPVNFYFRGADPTPIEDVCLVAINRPVMIGEVTVLPGDIAHVTPSGATFVPAHLAAEVVPMARRISDRDVFTKVRLSQARYGAAQLDLEVWPTEIEDDYQAWRATAEGLVGDRHSLA